MGQGVGCLSCEVPFEEQSRRGKQLCRMMAKVDPMMGSRMREIRTLAHRAGMAAFEALEKEGKRPASEMR